MPSQYAVDHPTFPPCRDQGIAKPQQSAARYLEFAGYIGQRFFFFANPRASSSSLYPGGFTPWISKITEDTLVLTSTGAIRFMW